MNTQKNVKKAQCVGTFTIYELNGVSKKSLARGDTKTTFCIGLLIKKLYIKTINKTTLTAMTAKTKAMDDFLNLVRTLSSKCISLIKVLRRSHQIVESALSCSVLDSFEKNPDTDADDFQHLMVSSIILLRYFTVCL